MAREAGRRPLVVLLAEDRLALVAVAGSAAVAVGAFLPWVSVPLGVSVVTQSGLEADGKLALVAGVLGFAFVIAGLRLRARDLAWLAAVAAAAGAAVAAAYLLDIRSASADVVARLVEGRGNLDPGAVGTRFAARPGPGAWLSLAGGAAAAVAAAILAVRGPVEDDAGEEGP